jgi:hypothetical protein
VIISHLNGVSLNRNTLFPLKVHVIQNLGHHLPLIERTGKVPVLRTQN